MAWAQAEKNELISTFRSTDPDAATLDAGWNARRLLAHLVLREQTPWLMVADSIRKPVPGRERHLGKLVNSARSPDGYRALIARFASGPSALSALSWLGDSAFLLEYVIHHEDIRRSGAGRPPRALPVGKQEAIWRQLPLMARMGYRKCPVGVEIARTGGAGRLIHKGRDAVRIEGDPVELALHAMGRRPAADVRVSGKPASIARFQQWSAG
ncbi:TIGR03085 family protein [Paenarthrobacter sp. Z7-10]|uniref:TIGR03085 family metal-binding protein n=1 Tax=Paenarthrobacter sp. Z7-10 TaxID=2787635 RepID=UPI0022A8E789|nr:TIGR03085 family metal-binding protein [Paenarthrobacter sp. Z7-10]MCZ2404190.1 TIGR03085 family protein [Paenarthrobacter sp. Z7-10]